MTPDPGSQLLTDLTGTTWYFNSTISVPDSGSYGINFTSNNVLWSSMFFFPIDDQNMLWYYNSTYEDTYAYVDGGGWYNNSYRTISITGGTDATNATLIAWLQANATQTT